MTKLLYLDETYRFDADGTISEVGQDEKGLYIIMDQTIFYPQGGGQPSDKGSILLHETNIPLTFVGFVEGQVRHYVPESFNKEIVVGAHAKQIVERLVRMDNARLHTGGHMISHVLETIDRRLIPIKGYHFPNGAYVEFLNEGGVDGASMIEYANDKLRSDVLEGIEISARLTDFSEISELRPNLAPFIPKDKPSRVVTIGSYRALPCGGTHVGNATQMGSIRISKIKNQKGNLKVSYEIGDPS